MHDDIRFQPDLDTQFAERLSQESEALVDRYQVIDLTAGVLKRIHAAQTERAVASRRRSTRRLVLVAASSLAASVALLLAAWSFTGPRDSVAVGVRDAASSRSEQAPQVAVSPPPLSAAEQARGAAVVDAAVASLAKLQVDAQQTQRFFRRLAVEEDGGGGDEMEMVEAELRRQRPLTIAHLAASVLGR